MKKAVVISVIGSGGKTTCINAIAEEARKQGKRAAAVTTTHMWIPDRDCIVGRPWEEAAELLDKKGIVYFGTAAEVEGKMVFPGREGYEALCDRADVMLVEADGAKRKPMKLPDWSREPVIPANTDVIFLVFGLSALGKRLGEVCHRWELGKRILNIEGIEHRIVTKEIAWLFLEKGYLEELRRRFSAISVVVLLNQADNQERKEAGEWMRKKLEREMVTCRVVQLSGGKNDSSFRNLHGIGVWEEIWEQ